MQSQRDKCFPNDGKQWVVSRGSGASVVPEVVSMSVKQQRYPQILFRYKDDHFTVEFANETDYMAARDSGYIVNIELVTARSRKRIAGTIQRVEILL